jgi:nicotinamide-nucleotide amidase
MGARHAYLQVAADNVPAIALYCCEFGFDEALHLPGTAGARGSGIERRRHRHLATSLGRRAQRRSVTVAVAESCTGGGVSEAITRIAGSSGWFDRGFVTYSNAAKCEMVGVDPATIEDFGAVSEDVARAMARGAIEHSTASVSVAITGIAGPGGATPGKPVGLVWFAWAVRGGAVQSRCFEFEGDRGRVRHQSIAMAIQGLIDLLR